MGFLTLACYWCTFLWNQRLFPQKLYAWIVLYFTLSQEKRIVSVRYCRIKTMPRVEKKDLLGTRPQGCHSRVQSEAAWLEWVVGFIARAKPWGRERVSGLWLSVTTRWNRWTCLASWVTGSSWVILQAKKQSEKKQGSWASSHKSGDLVSVLALGTSTHPKKSGT
jgi:hypothetical protein